MACSMACAASPTPTNGNGKEAWQEKSAVALSLWVGGVGLASAKGMVYLATGSVLVRASMFDSLGDVFSSFIMYVTQWKANDPRDMHRYPMGKGRFVSLGVLFFCAFMCSTMLSMVLDSLQELLKDDSQEGPSAGVAVRSLLEEQGHLRHGFSPFFARRLNPAQVKYLVNKYGGGEDEEGDGFDSLSLLLLGVCVVVKVVLYFYCKFINSRKNSEIVSALSSDHFNDTISNTCVIATMAALSHFAGNSWLDKADPAVSLLLSLWILYGWVSNALEQFRLLSDHRAEDADIEAMDAAVKSTLEGSDLKFQSTEVYHVGDGLRVQLKMCPASENGEVTRLASLFDSVEGAVRQCSSEVQQVDVHLRSRAKNEQSFDWVKEYAAK